MPDKEITRREVIRFLGVEIPLVIVSSQILPRPAFGQTYPENAYYTQKVARLGKHVILDLMDNPDVYILFSPVYNESRNVIGGKIDDFAGEVAGVADPKGIDLHGATLYAINGETLDAGSNEAIQAAFARMRKFVEAGEPVIWDVGNKGKYYQYVMEIV